MLAMLRLLPLQSHVLLVLLLLLHPHLLLLLLPHHPHLLLVLLLFLPQLRKLLPQKILLKAPQVAAVLLALQAGLVQQVHPIDVARQVLLGGSVLLALLAVAAQQGLQEEAEGVGVLGEEGLLVNEIIAEGMVYPARGNGALIALLWWGLALD